MTVLAGRTMILNTNDPLLTVGRNSAGFYTLAAFKKDGTHLMTLTLNESSVRWLMKELSKVSCEVDDEGAW